LPKYIFNKKYLIYITLVLFLLINIYIECSRFVTSKSSLEIISKVDNFGILDVTHPGVIEGHNGNLFNLNFNLNDNKYIIISGFDQKSVLSVTNSVLFITITYSVIPLPSN
jgi:hypothetical protein